MLPGEGEHYARLNGCEIAGPEHSTVPRNECMAQTADQDLDRIIAPRAQRIDIAGLDGGDERFWIIDLDRWSRKILRLQKTTSPTPGHCAVVLQRSANAP